MNMQVAAIEKLNAKSFLQKFLQIFEDEREKAVKAYPSNKDFTRFIIPRINKILGNETFDQVLVSNEYFRIDAIKWSDLKPKIGDCKYLSKYLWDLEIAVEHENDDRAWMDEVIKLAHVCCSLRVVIGYLPHGKRCDADDADIKCLDYITVGLKELSCYNNMKHGEFMIILGNSRTSQNQKNYFGYKGYLFDAKTEKFIELLP